MLRGGLIGLGNVSAGVHLPALARCPDVDLVAVTDVRPARCQELASVLGGARWYDSAEALLAEARLDFVDICTPPSSHGPLIAAALDRGLHVLCEKPLVSAVAELAALAARAVAAGRVLHTVHNWHHAPIVERTRSLIAGGAIGTLRRVQWQTLRTQPAAAGDGREGNWRLDPGVGGGGVLTDHGWHVAYILMSWIGQRPGGVSARLETRRHATPVEDTATVRIAFPSATAEVFLTWAAETRGNRAEATGTAGTLHVDDDVLVLRRGADEQRWTLRPGLSSGSVHPDWFDPIVARFLAEVRSGTPDTANLAEAYFCAALEAAARESSRRAGAPVAIDARPLAVLGPPR